jgi:uncharacterized OB-fold protein
MAEPCMSDQSYAQFLREDKIMGSRCGGCGALSVPPRAVCSECHQSEMDWVEMKGTGTLVAFTSISIGPPFMIEQGYDRKNPYCTAVIKLDEGPRVVARLEGVDAIHPESIRIGLPMRAKFLHGEADGDLKTSLVFTPI